MVPVKSCMVPIEKIVKVDRDVVVKTAAEMMRDNGIGSIFITSGEEIIGILTDTGLVRRDPLTTTVEKIMSAPIASIEGNCTLLDANDLMAEKHIRHLGITKDGEMAGMISVRDLVVFLTNLPRK